MCVQAPELVEGKSFYSEAIDIYALAITIWQIWSGNDPFDGVDTFSLYDMIMHGKRPPLPVGAPPGFTEVICDGWDPSASHRVSAQSMADRLNVVLEDYRAEHSRCRTMSISSRVTTESETMQILGNTSVIDDEAQPSHSSYAHLGSDAKRGVLSIPQSTQCGQLTVSPVHSSRQLRITTSLGACDYDCLEDGLAEQTFDMDLDLAGYTDDELYQGYGRKSAVDIKKTNPLVPQIKKSIMGIVSPNSTKSKGRVW